MGSKNKLKRFRENEGFAHVLQPTREEILTGQYAQPGYWSSFFGNDHPIVLELGCGKGEYTIGLAKRHKNINYIGVDIKGARFWRGAKTAHESGLKNVAFVRTQIELIDLVFAAQSIAEIWITFPDPQIKFKRTKHRMTNPAFLAKYKKILTPGAPVHLKTDSAFLHGYTLGLCFGLGLEIEYANHHVYRNEGSPAEVLEIQTFYEAQYLALGTPITYMRFIP